MKISVLGTEYSIVTASEIEEPRLKDAIGFCDWTTHEIIMRDEIESDLGNMEAYRKKVLRHEIIHAFMLESGLDECSLAVDYWSVNEEMIDWFARQGPRIYKAWREAGAM